MDFSSIISGMTSALQLLQGAVRARDSAKINAATADLTQRMLEIGQAAAAAQERVATLLLSEGELRRRVAELEQRQRERENYTLHEIRPGAFAYASQQPVASVDTPQHYLCQPCFDDGLKRVLRFEPAGNYYPAKWTCTHNPQHGFTDPTR